MHDSKSQASIPGASVRGLVFSDDRVYSITEDVTDQDGRYELTLESRPSLAGELQYGFAIDVRAAGFTQGYQSIAPERVINENIEVDFSLHPGCNFIGQVLNDQMRPVSNASVFLYDRERIEDAGQSRQPLASTGTNRGGLFSLPLLSPGAYRVHAQLEGHGTAGLDFEVLSLLEDFEPPPLVLAGAGSLFGRLIIPDGMPAKGAVLTARALDVDPGQSGLTSASAVTDGNGSFRFSGLKPGVYELKADAMCTIEHRASTGNQMHTLVVENGHGVIVSVMSGGRRVVADSVVFRFDGPGGGVKMNTSPEEDGLYCFYACNSGFVTILVTKGDLTQSRTVNVTAEQVTYAVDVIMDEATSIALGELELDVLLDESITTEIQYSIVLQNAESGQVLTHRDRTSSRFVLISGLPAGEYRGRWLPTVRGNLPPVLATEFEVSIRPGSRTSAELSVRSGALIELLVFLGGPPAMDLRAEIASVATGQRIVLNPTEVKEESIHTGLSFQTDTRVLLSAAGQAVACGDYELRVSSRSSAVDPLIVPVTLAAGDNLVRLNAVRSR